MPNNPATGEPHIHRVQIYYEDTDLTGAVYHANYLAYFERAREHMLGVKGLVDMFRNEGLGFVVHRAEVTFRAPSFHGDELEILSTARCESDYRIVFDHRARGAGETNPRVFGLLTLVCVGSDQQLVPLPERIRADVQRRWGESNARG